MIHWHRKHGFDGFGQTHQFSEMGLWTSKFLGNSVFWYIILLLRRFRTHQSKIIAAPLWYSLYIQPYPKFEYFINALEECFNLPGWLFLYFVLKPDKLSYFRPCIIENSDEKNKGKEQHLWNRGKLFSWPSWASKIHLIAVCNCNIDLMDGFRGSVSGGSNGARAPLNF